MSADANVFRWAIRRFFSKTELDAGALDARYFAESEFVATSAGAGDAGKPVKLNGSGLLDATMLTGSLTGYALLAGRSGGQTLNGDTASGGNLTLASTAHGTKGKIIFGSAAAYDEANARLGLGTANPSVTFHVTGSSGTGGVVAGLYDTATPSGTSEGPFYQLGFNGGSAKYNVAGDIVARFGFQGQGNDFSYMAAEIRSNVTTGGNAVRANHIGNLTILTKGSGSATPTLRATFNSSGLDVSGTITQSTVPVVTTTGTQTLTNKTLTAPVISTISNTGTLTLPTSTDTLVGRATTDTLTNKTLTTPTIASFTNATHTHQSSAGGGQLDHGAALTGLTDDDHTNYALLAGRASGQTLNGGNAANEDLTIHGTAHATKTSSYVIIQPSGGQTIVGASSPLVTHPFEVQANNYAITLNPGFGSATNYISSYTSGSPAPLALYGSRVFVGDTLGIGTAKTPASATDTGVTGQICWNSTHLFVAVATNTWKRVALTTW